MQCRSRRIAVQTVRNLLDLIRRKFLHIRHRRTLRKLTHSTGHVTASRHAQTFKPGEQRRRPCRCAARSQEKRSRGAGARAAIQRPLALTQADGAMRRRRPAHRASASRIRRARWRLLRHRRAARRRPLQARSRRKPLAGCCARLASICCCTQATTSASIQRTAALPIVMGFGNWPRAMRSYNAFLSSPQICDTRRRGIRTGIGLSAMSSPSERKGARRDGAAWLLFKIASRKYAPQLRHRAPQLRWRSR